MRGDTYKVLVRDEDGNWAAVWEGTYYNLADAHCKSLSRSGKAVTLVIHSYDPEKDWHSDRYISYPARDVRDAPPFATGTAAILEKQDSWYDEHLYQQQVGERR